MDYANMSIEELANELALYGLIWYGFADEAADDADVEILEAWGVK